MKNVLYGIGTAAALAAPAVFLSSPAHAECTRTIPFTASGTNRQAVECISSGSDPDKGINTARRTSTSGNNYSFEVQGISTESIAVGMLLNSNGAALQGTRSDGTRGACRGDVFGSNPGTFRCANASAALAQILITAN